jgi:hypothetical protein
MSNILNAICNVQNKTDKAQAFKGVHSSSVGVDLMIVDIPEGLSISMVSSPLTSIPKWNAVVKDFLSMLIDFGSSLVHDNGVLPLFHKGNVQLRADIKGFAEAYHFSILKEWMGINRLQITSTRDSFKTVSDSCLIICFIHSNT